MVDCGQRGAGERVICDVQDNPFENAVVITWDCVGNCAGAEEPRLWKREIENMEPFETINQWSWLGVNLAKIVAWPIAAVIAAWWMRPLIAPLLLSLGRRKVNVEAFGIKANID